MSLQIVLSEISRSPISINVLLWQVSEDNLRQGGKDTTFSMKIDYTCLTKEYCECYQGTLIP